MSFPALPRRRVSKPSVWLVTFGDLLTLLLCFFIATMTLHPSHSPSTRRATARNSTISGKESVLDAGQRALGTTLALTQDRQSVLHQPPEEKIEVKVALSDDSFAQVRSKLSDTAKRKLNNAVFTDGYSVRAVVVHACADKKRYAAEETASLSVERALKVRGQLIDSGVAPEVVRVRALGEQCAALPAHARGGNAVVVEITQVRKHHG